MNTEGIRLTAKIVIGLTPEGHVVSDAFVANRMLFNLMIETARQDILRKMVAVEEGVAKEVSCGRSSPVDSSGGVPDRTATRDRVGGVEGGELGRGECVAAVDSAGPGVFGGVVGGVASGAGKSG